MCLRDSDPSSPPPQQIRHHQPAAALRSSARPRPPPRYRYSSPYSISPPPSRNRRSPSPVEDPLAGFNLYYYGDSRGPPDRRRPSPPPRPRRPSPPRRRYESPPLPCSPRSGSTHPLPVQIRLPPPPSRFPSATHAHAALFPSPPAQSNRRHSPPPVEKSVSRFRNTSPSPAPEQNPRARTCTVSARSCDSAPPPRNPPLPRANPSPPPPFLSPASAFADSVRETHPPNLAQIRVSLRSSPPPLPNNPPPTSPRPGSSSPNPGQNRRGTPPLILAYPGRGTFPPPSPFPPPLTPISPAIQIQKQPQTNPFQLQLQIQIQKQQANNVPYVSSSRRQGRVSKPIALYEVITKLFQSQLLSFMDELIFIEYVDSPPTSDVSTIRGRIVFKKGRMIPYIIGPNGGRARPPRARIKDREFTDSLSRYKCPTPLCVVPFCFV